MLQNSEEITDKEQETHQIQPCIQSDNAQEISKFSQKVMNQEIIFISLDSEKEMEAEPKKAIKNYGNFEILVQKRAVNASQMK